MKDTPLQKAIAEITAGEYLPDAELRWVTKILQSLLPYEMECFVETYNNGAMCDMHVRENKDGTNTQVHLSAYDYFNATYNQ